MRGVFAVPVLAVLTVVSLPAASTPQDPPPQLPPVFRGEVDVIRLDVSVLDHDRRPITGLTASDFTVLEDGVPQRIAAISEVVVADRDATPTAWMRLATPDTSTNDLVDQLGDGRPYAIVMDDWTIAADDLALVHEARAAGREIVMHLASSDVAAVVFVRDTSRTVDFTTDRGKLIDAINGFEGRRPRPLPDRWVTTTPGPLNPLVPKSPTTPGTRGGIGGTNASADMPGRPKLECEEQQPLVPTLETVVRRLAMVTNRRKSLVFITAGTPNQEVVDNWNVPRTQTVGGGRGMIPAGGECAPIRVSQLSQIYGAAQQANINIYSVDLSDNQKLASTLTPTMRRLFLDDLASYTGGLVVGANGDTIEASVGRVFAEAGSYYLIGYQSSNGAPDGTYRRVEVRVNRPYVTTRTQAGYFATTPDGARTRVAWDPSGQSISSLWAALATRDEEWARKELPANSLAASGLSAPASLPLRASVVPVGLSAGAGSRRDMDVAVTLSVRLPGARGPLPETLTLVRIVYDPTGRPGPPIQEKVALTVPRSTGDELRYDVFQRLKLGPGRYEMRLNAKSAALGRDGTVFAKFDVPDVARAPVALSGIAIGAAPAPGVARTDAVAALLPIVPTSARSFAASDQVQAYFQIFQGSPAPVLPVTLTVRILDQRDQPVLNTTETLGAEAFGAEHVAAQQFALPLGTMTPGPYVLSVTATRPGSPPARREVVFRVR